MPARSSDLDAVLAELIGRIEAVERGTQLGRSTVELPSGEALPVTGTAQAAQAAAAAVPVLEADLATTHLEVDSVGVDFDALREDLDGRFEVAAADLADARENLAAAQTLLDDTFVEVQGMSGDIDSAIVAAGNAEAYAQQAAEDALAASGLAATKGELIVQVSAPTGSRANPANLWIDISAGADGIPKNRPNRYNPATSKWEPLTDKAAADAAAAAVAAQQAADTKPLILFSSTSQPTGTAPTGSTWFLINAAKNIVGQWQQTGTLAAPVWTPRAIASDVIANLDVGKLTAGNAAIADLVAQKIAASTATIQTVNVGNLFVTEGATMKQAVIDYLFAKVVKAQSFEGVEFTGATFRTAATGQRAELLGNRMDIYSPSNKNVGRIVGLDVNNGAVAIGPPGYEVYLGNVSSDGKTAVRLYTESADIGTIRASRMQASQYVDGSGRSIVAGPVASDSERDTTYPSPKWGDTVVRSDKNWTEQYGPSVSSDGSTASVGWYPVSGAMPAVYAGSQAGQSVSSAVMTPAALSSTLERGGFVKRASGGGHEWVVPFRGAHSVSVAVDTATSSGGQREVGVYVNGTLVGRMAMPVASSASVSLPVSIPDLILSAGDAVQFRMFQNQTSGAALTFAVRSASIRYLGPA